MGTTAGAAAQLRTGAALGMFIREGNNRGPAADAATGRQTGHLQDKRNNKGLFKRKTKGYAASVAHVDAVCLLDCLCMSTHPASIRTPTSFKVHI
jgi:hypothetical protein